LPANSQTAALSGWRRSADRTRLQANSLLTGNFTGNFAILGLSGADEEQKSAVPQRFFFEFPTQGNREIILDNREFFRVNREFQCSGALPRRSPT
jgi:hypothetical protein